jgi:hypothetical protein
MVKTSFLQVTPITSYESIQIYIYIHTYTYTLLIEVPKPRAPGTSTYIHMWPYVTICDHMWPYVTICDHMWPYVTMCVCLVTLIIFVCVSKPTKICCSIPAVSLAQPRHGVRRPLVTRRSLRRPVGETQNVVSWGKNGENWWCSMV